MRAPTYFPHIPSIDAAIDAVISELEAGWHKESDRCARWRAGGKLARLCDEAGTRFCQFDCPFRSVAA
jgi:hypothetical protein